MSGGPLYAKFGDKRIAIGIHVSGGNRANIATRIGAVAYKLFDEHRSW